jgi:hypothetical protein
MDLLNVRPSSNGNIQLEERTFSRHQLGCRLASDDTPLEGGSYPKQRSPCPFLCSGFFLVDKETNLNWHKHSTHWFPSWHLTNDLLDPSPDLLSIDQ